MFLKNQILKSNTINFLKHFVIIIFVLIFVRNYSIIVINLHREVSRITNTFIIIILAYQKLFNNCYKFTSRSFYNRFAKIEIRKYVNLEIPYEVLQSFIK